MDAIRTGDDVHIEVIIWSYPVNSRIPRLGLTSAYGCDMNFADCIFQHAEIHIPVFTRTFIAKEYSDALPEIS